MYRVSRMGQLRLLGFAILFCAAGEIGAQVNWPCDWNYNQIFFTAEKGAALPAPKTVPFQCLNSCYYSHVNVVDLPPWLDCTRVGNAYSFQINTTELEAPCVYSWGFHLETLPCQGNGTALYSNIYVQYRLDPISRLTLSGIRVIGSEMDTTYSPHSFKTLQIGDRIFITGRARDESGKGLAGRSIRCYDPITAGRDPHDSCVFNITTDSEGYFTYPDSAANPNGIRCDSANIYGFWFNVDSVGVPLLIGVRETCRQRDCLLDSVLQSSIELDWPTGAGIGIADTSNALSLKFTAYPLVDEYLLSSDNDDFFEGYLFCFGGDTTEAFLNSWLSRGLALHTARVERFAASMKQSLSPGAGAIRILAERTDQGWQSPENIATAPERDIESWEWGAYSIENTVCYMTDGGVVGHPGTQGVSVFTCAPFVVSSPHEFLVPGQSASWVCHYDLKSKNALPCQASGDISSDIGAMVCSARNTYGARLADHADWWFNSHNRIYDRLRSAAVLLKDLKSFASSGHLWIYTLGAAPIYYHDLGTSAIGAFGFTNLQSTNPNNPTAGNTRFQSIQIIRDNPQFAIQSGWNSAVDPSTLTITVVPDRNLFESGSTKYAQPSIAINSDGTRQPLTFSSINHNTRTYTAEIPVQSIPGYVAGQPFVGEIVVEGSDINSNFGADSVVVAFGQCGDAGLSLLTSAGEGVVIPENCVVSLNSIAVNSLGATPSSEVPSGDSVEAYLVVGNVLCINPDTADLKKPATVSVALKDNYRRYLGTGRELQLHRWDSETDTWITISSTLDSAHNLLTGSTARFGIVAPMISYYRACCTGVTGNVNMTGIVDLADLSALVSYLTGMGYILPCVDEANVNATGIVDLSDLSALVSYLTGGGYVLPICP